MKLLVTDDEVISVKGLMAGVNWKSCGIDEVFCAYSAADARRICEEQEIAILLCDIEMPGENGIELIRWIREQKPHIECLLLTCHTDFQYAQEALKLGCNDYLVKPVPYVEIEKSIQKMARKVELRETDRQLAIYGRQWLDEKIGKNEQKTGKHWRPEEIVSRVQAYILQNLSQELTVEQIARIVNLNPDYLGRIFKKETGSSINRYIIDERMKVAARMLTETELPANVIASECGYLNYPNFVNMFKKIYGISPNRYRGQTVS